MILIIKHWKIQQMKGINISLQSDIRGSLRHHHTSRSPLTHRPSKMCCSSSQHSKSLLHIQMSWPVLSFHPELSTVHSQNFCRTSTCQFWTVTQHIHTHCVVSWLLRTAPVSHCAFVRLWRWSPRAKNIMTKKGKTFFIYPKPLSQGKPEVLSLTSSVSHTPRAHNKERPHHFHCELHKTQKVNLEGFCVSKMDFSSIICYTDFPRCFKTNKLLFLCDPEREMV